MKLRGLWPYLVGLCAVCVFVLLGATLMTSASGETLVSKVRREHQELSASTDSVLMAAVECTATVDGLLRKNTELRVLLKRNQGGPNVR